MMSDSGDSDHIGYLAAQSSDDDSQLERSSNDDDDDGVEVDDEDELDSASDGLSESNGFFDLEAADSDDDVSGSSESGTDRDHDEQEDHFFPQFKRLPFELRYCIWEFFCPDLTAKPRVLCFQLNQHHRRDGSKYLVPVEGPFLDQQTTPARAMLAVHRESRQLIEKVFPDSLSFGSEAVVRFNAESDIVYLQSRHSSMVLDLDAMPQLPGFGEHIYHLAVDPANLFAMGRRAPGPSKPFKNLKTVYYVTDLVNHERRHIKWCFSNLSKRYVIDTFEEQPGLGENAQHVYCWPDIGDSGTVDETKVLLREMIHDLLKAGYPADTKSANFNGAPVWPLITFLWAPRLPLADLKPWDAVRSPSPESSGSEHSDEEEPNEYESEGIDDSDIDDYSESSDDELLVAPPVDGDDSDQSEQNEDASSFMSSSPHPGGYVQDGAIDLTGDDDEDMARFSSPEPSSETLRGSDNSAHESDSDQPAVRTSRLKRPRARVVESDSEDDSEDAGPRKRARIDNRRNPIVLSSDDEEDERRVMRANRRARAVISEDEEDQDDEDNEDDEQGNDSMEEVRSRENAQSVISSSDEEDGESDGGAAVGRPLSLAEKLQLHRENNPIPPSDDEDSEIEEMGGDDYDARDYADFQDDEEGDEIAEDGDEDDQYGLVEDEFDEEDDGY
ncbi:uncharacterized protein B0H64DRAFT_389333 [Chaetomium fimeti]|uniref:2EXR domain-containing protein n=1 Tax=Chaetomium fimeti TaxID=1854472 RepID=A0AAE0LWX4_9PEZI|nr:hypothetical protein B0H64DRAFT_389333 [Chaetomium fimeti]